MPLIVNEINIPTTKGSIVVDGTVVEKVDVVKDGITTTVWQIPTAYYAYQNGVAVNGISNPTIISNVSNGASCNAVIGTYDGGIGLIVNQITSVNDKGPSVTMRTPHLPTNGNKSCSIDLSYNYTSGQGVLSVYYNVYGVSTDGTEILLKSGYIGDAETGSFILSVDSYQSIFIEGSIIAGKDNAMNRTAWVLIKNCYFS